MISGLHSITIADGQNLRFAGHIWNKTGSIPTLQIGDGTTFQISQS
ncbi:MAG UNVERIFIED_CONTAM: hypothetical protein LVQ98_01535 [Rickettsiaceae bacterium]|jgi:hypothetical protein